VKAWKLSKDLLLQGFKTACFVEVHESLSRACWDILSQFAFLKHLDLRIHLKKNTIDVKTDFCSLDG
jgi:hypothetical protein